MVPEGKSRIIITLSDNLLEKVVNYADEVGITKSAAISVLLTNQFQQIDGLATMKAMTDYMKKEDSLNDKIG